MGGARPLLPTLTEDYVLACYRYIELNPVRSGMVVKPEDSRWSSSTPMGWARRTPRSRHTINTCGWVKYPPNGASPTANYSGRMLMRLWWRRFAAPPMATSPWAENAFTRRLGQGLGDGRCGKCQADHDWKGGRLMGRNSSYCKKPWSAPIIRIAQRGHRRNLLASVPADLRPP